MRLKRIAAFGGICGGLAAMIAGATTSGGRRPAPLPLVSAPAVEVQGAELAAEIARLRERLRPTTAPVLPARDLFHFTGRTSASDPALTPGEQEFPVALPAPDTAPPLNLVGIAEDEAGDAPVRSAIIAAFGGLFIVKPGETVAGRYRVTSVGTDGVELLDPEGRAVRLVLR
jgi:hypothetical protein